MLLFLGAFLIYKNSYQNPRTWYDHYLHLTKSIIQGRIDIPDLPQFYHDKIEFEGKVYIPFPPAPSIVLVPFVLLNNNISQQQVSILIGAINIALIYLLLINFTSSKNSVFLSIFFAFGTSYFWSTIVGTTWFFSHVITIFFVTLSLILHFKQRHFLSGIFFAFAVLTRLPTMLSGIFYIFQLFKKRIKLIYFFAGASVFVPILLLYNFMRFGNILETGYGKVYKQYTGVKVSISENFGYFNYKNVPLHLYTFFIMPPNILISGGYLKDLRPSPFGMGILFTSPLLFLAFKPTFKKGIELNSIITTLLVSLPIFFHYAQGWVQFGYRFMLDFIVFLMIILAHRFKPTRFNLLLIFISVIVNYWGVLWAIELGW